MSNRQSNSFIKKYKEKIPVDLENCIIKTLLEEAREQSIIAHIINVPDRPVVALKILRKKEKILVEEDMEALRKALGDNRSDWPPRTILFTIMDLKKDKAIIMVWEHYSSGITSFTRGGQRQKWEFIKGPEGWKAQNKEILTVWD